MRFYVAFAVASLAAVGQQPTPGVEISLTGTARVFHVGEVFRASLRVPAAPFRDVPAERWQFGGFLLDPPIPDGCGRIETPCGPSYRMGFKKSEPTLRLGDSPDPVTVTLSNYLPRLKPGTYRVSLLLRKLVRMGQAPMRTTYGYATPPVYATSNAVSFEIVASDDAWRAATLARSVEAIHTKQARDAAEQIRALDTPPSWRAALAAMPVEDYILLEGFANTMQPGPVCKLMEDSIAQPTQAVSFSYLYALTQVCARANLPAPPKYDLPKPGQTPVTTPEQTAWGNVRRAYDADVRSRATAALAASLPRKTDEARGIAVQTLLQTLQADRKTLPPWTSLLQEEFRKAYPKLDPWQQRFLMGTYVSLFRSPDAVPLLEAVLDAWKPGDHYESPREALHQLNTVDPARAQARIAAELVKEKTRLDVQHLDMLPADSMKVGDDVLIDKLARAQQPGGWNPQLRMAALARYASAEALPRIKAIYESQADSCQPELVAYFVRVEPSYADRVFHAEPWNMQSPPPRCAQQYFTRTPRIAYGPVLERYLIAYLNHNDVNLKKTAAESLGRYGTATAAGALWEMLRYFHDYWSPRLSELATNQEGPFLETAIRDALARAQGWFLGEADLRRIRMLCLTDRCRYETDQDLQKWIPPVRVGFLSDRGEAAQYYGIPSVEALERKMAQFPKGTSLLLTPGFGPEDERIAGRIRAFAASHGLSVVSP